MRSSGGAAPSIALDLGLIVAVLALAAFVLIANRPAPRVEGPPTTVARAAAAIAADPLNPAALRNLGLARAVAGNRAGARQLLDFAATRSRRDSPTERWLMADGVARGRFDEAFRAADALLRRDIDDRERERLFGLLTAAARHDASRPALVARLADNPWWRLAYMRKLDALADPRDAGAVFAALSTSAWPATPLELSPLLERLVALKQYRLAAQDWLQFAKPRHDPGDPSDLAAPAPFGWSEAEGAGGSSAIEDGALRVDYDGYGPARLPRRLLALPAGRFTLSWRERVESEHRPRLGVSLRCADTPDALAMHRASPGDAWRSVRLEVEVPASGCDGQWLAVDADPADRRDPATVWFAGWRVSPPPPA